MMMFNFFQLDYKILLTNQAGFNPKRIYKILFVIFIVSGIFSAPTYGQEVNAYRTITSGDYDQVAIWEIYNGNTWNTATQPPNEANDVYIDFDHEVTLTQNETVKSLYLNAETGTGKKLNLNGFELALLGSLNAFSGAAPGSPSGTWNNIDWIGDSEESKLIFKGTSRVAVPEGAWSAFSTRSRYTLVFAPDPGATLTVQESIKASRIVVASGTVIQETSGGACSTFSFNNDPAVPGAYGSLVIEDNATLESYCSESIVQRSASLPALEVTVSDRGTLVLHGPNPEINAANIHLLGEVRYVGASGTQGFITSTMPGVQQPIQYHDVTFKGDAEKILPPTLILLGNMANTGTGDINANTTSLSIEGTENQEITGMALLARDLEMNKSNGKVHLDSDLTILRDFIMTAGELDFSGNEMTINAAGSGEYQYLAGKWHDLQSLHYHSTPHSLTVQNASFPFVDKYEEGVRLLQVLGANDTGGENLTIQYTQLPGVDHDADFFDNDGTWILYQLYSYFSFSGFSSGNNFINIRIAADELIVDDVNDLRIVADHEPAAGSHLSGLDENGTFWAKRRLRRNALHHNKFTIGSERVATILPIAWLNYQGEAIGKSNILQWEVPADSRVKGFTIYRSAHNVDNFIPIGTITSESISGRVLTYQFTDETPPNHGYSYYRIASFSPSGKEDFTPVFHVYRKQAQTNYNTISPNPHSGGNVHLSISRQMQGDHIECIILDVQGGVVFGVNGKSENTIRRVEEKLPLLPKGIYIIRISDSSIHQTIRWIKL
ncbi:T9SS type A sorting domain-containing protein [Echinicola soli]|uniref:T9SS type A sorting domain-containing protein n=1 Tax=Echinicola soli TaxID=2591634 RepID=A0A514CEN0_9BACT|nr:T9SS type A sorting domain-containing protein [Echinicola soli]QDH78305.1 T9SS type A sorting domain-containing protein [Echinicola soli]